MKTVLITGAVVLLLGIEAAWIVAPRYGSPQVGDSYRNKGRVEALRKASEDTSPANRAIRNKRDRFADKA